MRLIIDLKTVIITLPQWLLGTVWEILEIDVTRLIRAINRPVVIQDHAQNIQLVVENNKKFPSY